jgi:peptide/nickel transport system permease protein
MIRLVLMRLLALLPVALTAVVLIFLLLQFAPGDPASLVAGPDAGPEEIALVRASLGLDRPLPVQFASWLLGVLSGDLGTSLVTGLEISETIGARLAITAQLAVSGAAIAIVLGLILGYASATRQGKWLDAVTSAGTGFAMAIPEFWFGILLVLLFAVNLGWLPSSGMPLVSDAPALALRSLILPSIAIALHPTALITRSVRASVGETMGQDYVRTARSKGIGGIRLGTRHVFRNSLIPILSIIGVQLGNMLGGAVIIESVFAVPGLGSLLVSAVGTRDFPVVQASLLVLMMIIILANLITDVSYGLADPRIRSGSGGRIARR